MSFASGRKHLLFVGNTKKAVVVYHLKNKKHEEGEGRTERLRKNPMVEVLGYSSITRPNDPGFADTKIKFFRVSFVHSITAANSYKQKTLQESLFR